MKPGIGDQHPWSCLKQDIRRYGGWSAFLKEQSLWAVFWYRAGSRLTLIKCGLLRRPLIAVWWLCFRFVEVFTGVSLPIGARIGGGLRIWHFGGIFVNSDAIIGSNCTLRQGVTIGSRSQNSGAPVIEDNVDVGAYAQILGHVRIGTNAKIGALSLVISDVPANSTAVGIPARSSVSQEKHTKNHDI